MLLMRKLMQRKQEPKAPILRNMVGPEDVDEDLESEITGKIDHWPLVKPIDHYHHHSIEFIFNVSFLIPLQTNVKVRLSEAGGQLSRAGHCQQISGEITGRTTWPRLRLSKTSRKKSLSKLHLSDTKKSS